MDSLTHVLVAGTLSMGMRGTDSAVRRTALMTVAALLPDLAEQAFRLFGAATYLRFYHGPFHSLLGAVLITVLVTLAGRHWEPPGTPFPVQIVPAAVGMASHLLLDLGHGWGVRLLWPISDHRFGVSLVANYDLPTLSILGVALLIPALLNSINREIGAPRVSGRRAAWVALVILVALVPARWVFRARSSNLVHASPLTEVESVSVYPSALLPWVWIEVEDTSLAYMVGEVDGLAGERRPFLIRLRKPQPNSLFLAVRDTPAGQLYLQMATYPFYSFEEGQEAIRIRVRDLAFFAPAGSDRLFSLETEITSTLKIVSEKAVF